MSNYTIVKEEVLYSITNTKNVNVGQLLMIENNETWYLKVRDEEPNFLNINKPLQQYTDQYIQLIVLDKDGKDTIVSEKNKAFKLTAGIQNPINFQQEQSHPQKIIRKYLGLSYQFY